MNEEVNSMALNWTGRLFTWLTVLSLLLVGASTPPHIAQAEPLQETPDSSFDSPMLINIIGKDSPVQATIGTPGDEDGFQFTAIAGRTYVIELFNVGASLGQGAQLYYCGGSNNYYRGMQLAIFDTVTNSEVALQCLPNGSGEVLTSVTIKAASSGAYKLRVRAHVSTSVGSYNLRVLPKYGEAGASWDAQTFEPNNSEATAYPVELGREHAITAFIEARDSIYSTHSGDNDWYRFEAVQGRSYVIELFNVSASIGQETALYFCQGVNNYYRGLALFVYDTVTQSPAALQCQANGAGHVLVTVSFKAASTGTYTFRVYPHVATAIGSYSLRVLPKYHEAGASWDVQTFEPNNSQANAFPLTPALASGITAVIEQRDSIFSTNSDDADWYTFQVRATETYTVEVSNVGGSLGLDSRLYFCDGFNNYYRGLRIAAFDATTGATLASRCMPNSSGTLHTSISFRAATTGPVTVLIFPHVSGEFGPYTLRVLGNVADQPPPAISIAFEGELVIDNIVAAEQPNLVSLSVQVRNTGSQTLPIVNVSFFRGDPTNGGDEIDRQQISNLAAGTTRTVTGTWQVASGGEETTIFAIATTQGVSTSKQRPVKVYWAPFNHGIDAYSFENKDVPKDLTVETRTFLAQSGVPGWTASALSSFFNLLTVGGGGVCYGMANSSLVYKHNGGLKPVPTKTTYQHSISEAQDALIRYQWAALLPGSRAMLTSFANSPRTEYEKTIAKLKAGEAVMHFFYQDSGRTVAAGRGELVGAHQVVAYKAIDLGAEQRVYYYDPNAPLDFLKGRQTTTGTFSGDTISINYYPWFNAVIMFERTPDLLTNVSDFLYDLGYAFLVKQWLANQTLFSASGSVDLIVVDQSGRRTGFANGTRYSEIPGASLAGSDVGQLVAVPTDGVYEVQLTPRAAIAQAQSFSLDIIHSLGSSQMEVVNFLDLPLTGPVATLTLSGRAQVPALSRGTGQPIQPTLRETITLVTRTYLPLIVRL